jgi:LDH2 family malate/lactate/ureidoglycolate dehydrogenase
MPHIHVDPLVDLVSNIFQATGAKAKTADIVAKSLVASDLAGHESHGVVRVQQYLMQIERGDINPKAAPAIVRDRGAVFNVDARDSFGQLSANYTMEEAIRRAKEYGLSAAGLFHSGHVGRLGEWVEMASAQGAIAFAYCNGGGPSPGRVTPFAGAGPLLGTNPVAAAVPVGEQPAIVLDFATSAVAEGKVRVYRNRGKSIPEGWILDREGMPTTDPNDLYDGGVLLPAAAHKGYALSLLVEYLGGILVGNGVPALPETYQPRNGVLFIVLDIEPFQPVQDFLSLSAAFVDTVKAVPPAPGFDEVLLPGEPEQRAIRERSKTGIEVDEATWGQLAEAAALYGLEMPEV